MSDDNTTERLPGDEMYQTQIILGAIKDLSDKLGALDQKVDARLHDTRPLWEGVQEQLSEIRDEVATLGNRFEVLENRFEILENRQVAMHADSEKGFRSLERKLEVVSIELVKIRADMRGVEERLSNLEQKPS